MEEENKVEQTEVVEESVTEESSDSSSQVKLTDEERLARLEGSAKRLRTKLGLDTPTKKEVKEEKTSSLDYAQKAFLVANGIKAAEDIAFVKEYMDNTGKKSIEEVLESEYFQMALEERREEKLVKMAVPSNSKRSTSSPKDSVAYWMAKGELPPLDQHDLRIKVVNARLKNATEGNPFSNQSVVQ